KQLIGIRQLGAPTCFTYCGNITPLKAPPTTLKLCKLICSEVSNTFGLVGSNGVDFVLDSSGKPWILEVNPRFQATIECVEKMLGINLVEAHIAACEGSLITPPSVSQGYFTRVILYAKRRCSVPDLSILYGVRDIPIPGVIVEKGEPVCSVFTTGQTETESIDKAIKCTRKIYRLLCVEKTAVS
ncbi:MAG: ATP-grasp domain-containing protein, partial [Nitrososphaerota archaeon]